MSKSFDIVDHGGAWRIVFGLRDTGPRFKALDGVTLEVPKGKFVGVIGRNGAGKSTLLRTFGGIYAPDSGSVRVAGELSGLYELGPASHRHLTGGEYARRMLSILGLPRARLDDTVAEVRDFSELDERFDDPLFSYSAGMGARLFFATATACEYDVYLVDEVLSVGDEHFQQKCWRRMRERLARGASGILVTHDWSAVLKLCETAHVLDRGRVLRSGPADTVVQSYLNIGSTFEVEAGIARFREPLPQHIKWACGREAGLSLAVDVLTDGEPVYLCYAIERLAVGIDWEIVLNGIDLAVADRRGRYSAHLSIPRLPLRPGVYELSLDLVTLPSGNRLDRRVVDGRGWLKGTPIAVEVCGADFDAQTMLPFDWEVRAA